MNKYLFQNNLINKKQLKNILAWTFTNYGPIKASIVSDELKSLGFKYSTLAGLSISIEDLRVPPIKNSLLKVSENEIAQAEIKCIKGEITEVERFQKIIGIWGFTSETLKNEVVSFFKNFDPLNSVYMMAFSGARGNLSQVRQLVGMRGLMSNPQGQLIDLPIKQNFREGLTITDYLISGYGARKGVVDTALKTANSGYLTRRLIDVAQDIVIKEKNCFTKKSLVLLNKKTNLKYTRSFYEIILGKVINKSIINPLNHNETLFFEGTILTPNVIETLDKNNINKILVRSPLTCNLSKAICQSCYGWNLATENLIDLGEAVGIMAGQSIGEPGTQLTMRTFHTGGIFTAGENEQIISPTNGFVKFSEFLQISKFRTTEGENVLKTENSGYVVIKSTDNNETRIEVLANTLLFVKSDNYVNKKDLIGQKLETGRKTKLEIKNILSKSQGEIFIDKSSNHNFLWVLFGNLYPIFMNFYLNFYKKGKLLKQNSISRIKLISKQAGTLNFINNTFNYSEQLIQIKSRALIFNNFNIKKLLNYTDKSYFVLNKGNKNFILNCFNFSKEKETGVNLSNIFGKLLTNNYITNTGGTPYFLESLYSVTNTETTLLWLSEETHYIDRDCNILLVENAEYVTNNYEIVPNTYSKISGVVDIIEKYGIINEIIIKPGILQKVKNFDSFDQKLFYPGEVLFGKVRLNQISFSEIVYTKFGVEVLIRPVSMYQVPKRKSASKIFKAPSNILEPIYFKNSILSTVVHGEKIKANYSLNLFEEIIEFDLYKKSGTLKRSDLNSSTIITKNNKFKFRLYENFYLNDYRPKKETDLKLSLIVEKNQFINCNSVIGYLEIFSKKYAEIIDIKVEKNSRIFFITDDNCITNIKNKKVSVTNNTNSLNITGKVLISDSNKILIQKGLPYFFPKDSKNFYQTGDLIEANQNIGQLTLKKEISGDIVQGLPRVDEIFEVRKNKNKVPLINETLLDLNFKLLPLATCLEGEESIDLHDFLKLYFDYYLTISDAYQASYRSLKKVQLLILNLIQSVYLSQSVSISDKHLEVIVKQITTKVKIIDSGSTNLLSSEIINLTKIKYINELMVLKGKKLATYEPFITGITRTSLLTDSFLSSASFQETTKVLTKAAIEGKVDWLRGLKENVIIGTKIPAGTGFNKYNKLFI